jgi:hypothetical protein
MCFNEVTLPELWITSTTWIATARFTSEITSYSLSGVIECS